VLSLIAKGKPGFDLVASGFAEHSPGGHSRAAGYNVEAALSL